MRSRQEEFIKIKLYKENWYALIACICSEKTKSIAQSCKSMGVKMRTEESEKFEITKYNEPMFDLDTIKSLYEDLGVVRQMAIKLEVNETSLRKFMNANGIVRDKIKPKISDSFDKEKIARLIKEGKSVKTISFITGYAYHNLNKFVAASKKEGALI